LARCVSLLHFSFLCFAFSFSQFCLSCT
jgi:hypothetical protein